MRIARVAAFLLLLGACGKGGASLEVVLYTPGAGDPDPFEGVQQLRVTLSGPQPFATRSQIFPVASGGGQFRDLPLARSVTVLVEGQGIGLDVLSRGYSPPVDLVGGMTRTLPVFFARIDRFAGNVGVSTGQRADLSDLRAGHAATLLRDGRVLITGGAVLSAQGAIVAQPLSRAEIYDSTTGVSRVVGNTVFARAFHTATQLKNGRVLIAGGASFINDSLTPLATAEIFDPVDGSFRAIGAMSEQKGRVSHTATLLPDGRVLIAGGWGQVPGGAREALQSAELYDPSRETFSAVGPMSKGRASHTATLLLSGKVLVVGGRGASGALFDAELFDPAIAGFSAGPPLPENVPRAGHAAVRLGSGLVLVAGGCSSPEPLGASLAAASGSGCHNAPAVGSVLSRVDLYEPSATGTGRFHGGCAPSLDVGRADLSATSLPGDGRVLFVGGVKGDGSTVSTVEIVEEREGCSFLKRRAAGELLQPRTLHAALRLASGVVLVAGGVGRSGPATTTGFSALGSIEVYVP